ncbi:polycystin-1 [Nerophis lumbriciformis]|uniref:polycystin-1 n=1 Tax=Nerophis lumbriciformis TaxID=546530 RepID=UPI002ADF6CAA|nr:polycystin-1 [Nerophis lumbriciformis]
MHAPQRQAWKILCVVLISTAGEDVPCPKGGQIHLPSLRCFWLSKKASTWSEASDSCQQTHGGDVAAADTLDVQDFLQHSFSVESTVWVWLKGASAGGPNLGGLVESARDGDVGEKLGECPQMALGRAGEWKTMPCSQQHRFLCENRLDEYSPDLDSYLVGVVLMTGIYHQFQIDPLLTLPDSEQFVVEMQLFPGLWFSHTGQLTSLELVVHPGPTASLARVQILRPYCSPSQHLVPPGCRSLLNPFSCCSVAPLCNTTGACSVGQYWCHILECCLPNSSPCSPYISATGVRRFALPPRYSSITPFYHLVADLPLRIRPLADLETLSVLLPQEAIMVYPDDIVAIQHTRKPGTFLHCLSNEASLNSPWRQSYLSLRGTAWGGWWEGGLTSMPPGGHWVDGVVCNVRLLYADTLHGTEEMFGQAETTTSSHMEALTPSVSSTFGLSIIHPPLDENNRIHLQINAPTVIVVKVLRGENARCSWSGPVLQTGLRFSPSCTEALPECKGQSGDAWFSSVTLVLPSVGVQTLNIRVTDDVGSQSLNVTICGYEGVSGLSVEPSEHQRMLVDIPQSFSAKVESGSSVTFSWVIDNLETFAYEGESYSVVFKKAAEYKLKSKQLLLIADEMTQLGEPEFLFARQVVAVGDTQLYTLRVEVDIALSATFRWDFGDGSSSVIHTEPAPCETLEGLVDRRKKQVYVQHSVNFTYFTQGDYTLQVEVSNKYEKQQKSTKICIRPLLKQLFIDSAPLVPIVDRTFRLEATTDPASNNIVLTWDFGDKSKAVQGTDHKVEHVFTSAGVYNITLCANNSLSVLNTWLVVEVMEEISRLSVSYDGPSELGSVTNLRAKVATGTALIWDFDFGDGSKLGNLTNGTVDHVYDFPGNYTVGVTVSNSVSHAQQFISVAVYELAVVGMLPAECITSGRNTEFTALVSGNVSMLAFHWLFGEELPVVVVEGRSTATHTFCSPGAYSVNLTVRSSNRTVSYNSTVCVETPVSRMSLQSSRHIAAVGDNVCFSVLFSAEECKGCQFEWFSSSSSQAAVTETALKCFTFRDEGVQEVYVTVSNKVSSKTANTSVTVQTLVSNFSVVRGSETVTVNTSASFWVASCSGSNVSVQWDFGDGFQAEQKQHVLHVFTATGDYNVNATAFNAISQESVTLKVTVLHPVSDFSLQTNQPYGVVGEEMHIRAVNSDNSSTTYSWTVDGLATPQQGTSQFKFVFPKAAVYQVRAISQNMVSRQEATISVEVFERIEGLSFDCPKLTNMTYLPTQEDVMFVATVTRGSDVKYRWLAEQRERMLQMAAGECFNLVVESPGKLSIQLNASNNLGKTTSMASVVAVERVRTAHITTRSHIVAVGKLMNISVSVLTGSDLKYFWFVDPDLPSIETHTSYLLHRFSSPGNCFVQVVVQNALSQSNDTKIFIVQEEVEEVDFKIDDKMFPFYIITDAVVSFQGVAHKGSDLQWFWKIRDVMTDIFDRTNITFIYIFPREGIYKVSLNVSNAVNWQEVSQNVFVQDKIEGLILNISKHTLCTGEDVTFRSNISKGSNVSYGLTFESQNWVHSRDVVEGMFMTSSLPTGTHFVKLKAWNQVSRAQVSNQVQIIENIQTLQLLSPSQHAIEALKERRFVVDEQSGFSVNYTWIFNIDGTKMVLTGKEADFTPPLGGLLSVTVVASNGVCSKMLNKTLTVEWPVQEVQVVCHSDRIFTGHVVTFSAKVNGGTNLQYLWGFGDSVEDLHFGTVNHTFGKAGVYVVTVNISNSVSHVSKQLPIKVEVLKCSSPRVSLIQSQTTIFKSRMALFEANVDMNCSDYKATYQWAMFRLSDSPNGNITRNLLNRTTSPLLLLPKHSLDVGEYCLLFTVSLQGTPLLVQQSTTVTVLHSPLVAVIKGGSHRLWPSLSDLFLDGSVSHDPDADPGREDTLQYRWTYYIELPAFFVSQNSTNPIKSNISIVTVPSKQLHPGTSYSFTLTVHKAGRTPASFTQTVKVSEIALLPVFVECVSCSMHTPIRLSGHCAGCEDQVQYEWSAEDETGSILDLDKVATFTGRHSSKLVLRSDVVLPGKMYTYTVNVTEPGSGRWGSASQKMVADKPPYGGLCVLNPVTGIHLLETVVTFNCSGWQDGESPASEFIYTFQVAPSHPSTGPPVTLYKGTRSSFGSMVPVGSPVHGQNKSLITVTLLIEGNLGVKVIALNRTLTVHSRVTASDWLRTKSQTELWALVQHGNPQEIIPYSIALTSQLNQMKPGLSTRELTMQAEIRENVTKALVSLPISSLMDVDQISSALAQSTAVPAELVCDDCQEKVLEAVKKMIRVMKEHTSPGVLSVFDTGRNILNIIGSSLSALSLSVNAPNSQQNYSRTLGAASSITLSALDTAGALMRSLMHAAGGVPLSFFTPYISTVGFHGDPSDLLCSKQSDPVISRSSSTPPCPFQIPTTLTAHLKSQRSELVQVVLGLDESHALLSAADPPISTSLVAMEITTPQGEPVPIQDLEPEQAIQVTLHNKHPVKQGDRENKLRNGGRHGDGTCTTVALPPDGRLNFTIKPVNGMDENAGLYISCNFSLEQGLTSGTSGRVKIEITSGFQDSLTKEWPITLSALNTFTEKTLFLSPLLKRREETLAVELTSSVAEGGPVRVSLCVFSSLCQYYSVKERSWSSEGLKPLEGSTLRTVHCLTRHLTMFGATLFVHPGAVVLLPPSGGPVLNVVVGIVCAVLVLIHLLVGLIAHKLDHLDSLRQSHVPLCGRSGLYHYRVQVKTGRRQGAGTTAHIGISLYGLNKSGSRHLQRDGAFQRGSLDQFHLETDDNLGEVWKIRIWHDNTGLDPSWYVQHVVVWDPVTDHMFFFLVEDWLSVENQKNGTVEKEILASCPEELTEFRRILSSQLLFGMVERHLWLSLWERPVHSRFTRSQRVTCSALILHLYLALGALWYGAVGSRGHSGAVSANLLVNMETVAVGMVVAVLLFPLQCLISFLFRKTHNKVIVDMSVPPSPVCHSVEMDVYLGQSALSGPSFLSLSESSSQVRDSPSSLLESNAFDSSILDFWAVSGLVPQTDAAVHGENATSWTSCDSLLKESDAPDLCEASLDVFPTRQLRRKKAHLQLHLTSSDPPAAKHAHPSLPAQDQHIISVNAHNRNIKTFLTLSEENLLMSIDEAKEDTSCLSKNNSDSGRDSPTTASSISNTQSTSCSSWSDHTEDKSLHEAEFLKFGPHACPSPFENKLHKCPSVQSVYSVASTFLPSPSPDSTRSSSTTRIGIARARPSQLLPPWVLCVIYPVVAVLIGSCLALVGIYGSLFSRTVVLMWLISALSAFLTSALLLEPLKVCVQALIYTIVWRPVDPEVEDQLAQETTVVKASGEHSGKVQPPCGYGLLQAKEEARKVRALRSLMRHCVYQLLFFLLVLMMNYQDNMEQRQGRLLHSAVRHQLLTAPLGVPNLTSVTSWLHAEQWMNTTLVNHLHHNPLLRLVGSPRLQYAHTPEWAEVIILGNSSVVTRRVLADLHKRGFYSKKFKTISLDFTQYHRESGLFLCVSVQLDRTQRVTSSLSIHPLLVPSSHKGLDLHLVLTVLLLSSALLILFGEVWSMATERAQYLCEGKHWLQLLLVTLSLATSVLQLCFLSQVTSCVSQLRSQPDSFINFHGPALLTRRSSQCAAILLTFLVLKLLGTLRFVQRWVMIIRVLQRAWKELWVLKILLLLLMLFCTHLSNTLFSRSVDGFLSMHQALVSLLSIMRGRNSLQRLCIAHPVLGPLYGLLVIGAGVWLLAKLFGAVLICAYRAEKADIYRPSTEPQDYEMVEFFIKRLKLWIGLTKAKEFRHRVKFEGMDVPPSRASQESRLSSLFSSPPSSHLPRSSPSFSSPRPLSSSLSTMSEDSSISEQGFDVQPFLDHLLPCVNALLSQFDRVTQITEDVNNLETELEEALTKRKEHKINKERMNDQFQKSANPKDQEGDRRTKEVRRRRTGLLYPNPQKSLSTILPFAPSTIHSSHVFPRTRSSHSECESVRFQYHVCCETSEASKFPAESSGVVRSPKRRAWHSGSSHSADAAQRLWQKQGGVAFAFIRPKSEEDVLRRISDGAPKKRKAWIAEEPEVK